MKNGRRSRWAVVAAGLLLTGQDAADLERVSDTKFSYNRGFYDTPFTVLIRSKTPGALIRYTLDGSAPTPTHGLGNANPVAVSVQGTTTLRAVAYKTGLRPTNVDTHTYLFIEDVLKQPYAVEGYPHPVLRARYRTNENVVLDYEMDAKIVDDPRYRLGIRKGLRSIPTISIVLAREDLFRQVTRSDGSGLDLRRSGVYLGDEGGGNTASASVELLYASAPQRGFQVDAALESHGWSSVKRAFLLKFQSEYGAGTWESPILRDAPLNGDSAPESFDRIVLRSGKERSWATTWHPDQTTYTRDQWARDTQIAMSRVGVHGTFVHLYLNGLYWGLYNATERPDAWFQAAHFGGEEDDWFSVNDGGPFRGDSSRWDHLLRLLKGDVTEPSRYREIQDYLDVVQFADYMLLSWYMGMRDWPQNNWWAGNRNNPPSPAMFFVWDAEESWGTTRDRLVASVHRGFRADERPDPNGRGLVFLWHSLRRNREFMTMFADRVYLHCFNDGALTEIHAIERWRTLAEFVSDAVIAESARWGDALAPLGQPTRTRDETFDREVERVITLISRNVPAFIHALRKEGYYPRIDPPRVSAPPGGKLLRLRNPSDRGTIYFTLDGEDPRAPGGEVAKEALTGAFGGEEIALEEGTTLRARIRAGGAWSALTTWP
ncbi:MAG: CotH kinase family protein [Vicinamibacteria bacterium]